MYICFCIYQYTLDDLIYVFPSLCPSVDAWLGKMVQSHNCFPLTPITMKLYIQTPYESRMCPSDFGFKRSHVKVTMHWLPKMARLEKMIPAHYCFPFTLFIRKFTQILPMSQGCALLIFYRWTEYDETWQNLMSSTKYFWRSDSMSWHLIGLDILVHFTDGSSALL